MNLPTTSYAAATFHPTIGQCAPQSLSNTATPELGMIPQGKRKLSRLTHSQGYPKIQPNQRVGFIRLSRDGSTIC